MCYGIEHFIKRLEINLAIQLFKRKLKCFVKHSGTYTIALLLLLNNMSGHHFFFLFQNNFIEHTHVQLTFTKDNLQQNENYNLKLTKKKPNTIKTLVVTKWERNQLSKARPSYSGRMF